MENKLTPAGLLLLALFSVAVASRALAANPQAGSRDRNDRILPRSESFLGFHFDFHASTDCDRIGRNLTEGMIDTLLMLTRPDYIQVDCKGHAGYSSYPTEVGNRAPGYEKDILKMFREVTRRHNVALYVHYSGLWDSRAVELHPDWAARHADGTPDSNAVAYYGPYVERLLVPQIKEIAARGVDGIWIDGECWAAIPDYSEAMRAKYERVTGRKVLPKEGEEGYAGFMELNRQAFKEYLTRYMTAVKAEYPGFQITSNWAYSSIMPEPVEAPVDYLSGDVAGQNGLYSAAWEARCMAPQGMPWDLMSWGFTYDGKTTFPSAKSVLMLQQEAAQVMALGGGFQAYYQQNRDGSLKTAYFDRMAALASWVRERQPYCQGSKPLHRIALWYSTAASKAVQQRVYQDLGRMNGVLDLLLDGRRQVEVLMDHHLGKMIADYPLIVLPEWEHVGDSMRSLALDYVRGGGKLLVIGPGAAANFLDELGVDTPDSARTCNVYLRADDWLGPVKHTRVQPVRPRPGTETFGSMYEGDDPRYWPAFSPMATIRPYGEGEIAAIYCDLNRPYLEARSEGMTGVVCRLVDRLLPEPLVTVAEPAPLHVVASQLGDRWMIHLINTAGDHSNRTVFSYDTAPALPPLTVGVATGRPVRRARLQPGNTVLPFRMQQGRCVIDVPPVAVHGIVELSF